MEKTLEMLDDLNKMHDNFRDGATMADALINGMIGTDRTPQEYIKALYLGWAHLETLTTELQQLIDKLFENTDALKGGAQ